MSNNDLIDEILIKLKSKRNKWYNSFLTEKYDKLYYRGLYEGVSSCIAEIEKLKGSDTYSSI